MSVLPKGISAVVALAANTPFQPGTRVSFKDREDPRPLDERVTGSVRGLSLYFDGEQLEMDGVVVAWDEESRGFALLGLEERVEIFQKEELDLLEILP